VNNFGISKKIIKIITDGNYCAEVAYYNPNTVTLSTYTLPVEVKEKKLKVVSNFELQ
jgi:hypothetical protein